MKHFNPFIFFQKHFKTFFEVITLHSVTNNVFMVLGEDDPLKVSPV